MKDWQTYQKKEKGKKPEFNKMWDIKMKVTMDFNEIQETIREGIENLH